MANNPVVVVVRHPDAGDDIRTFDTEAQVIYLDLGASFDVTKLSARWTDDEKAEVISWAYYAKAEADGCGNFAATEYAYSVIQSVLDALGDDWSVLDRFDPETEELREAGHD